MNARLVDLFYGLRARSWTALVPGDPAAVEQRVRAALWPTRGGWRSLALFQTSAQLRTDSDGREYVWLSRYRTIGNYLGLRERFYVTFSASPSGGTAVNVIQRCTPAVVAYCGAWLTVAWIVAIVLLVVGIVRQEPWVVVGLVLPVFGRLLIVEAGRRADAWGLRTWLRRVMQ
jgi:hypothetical protein